MGCKDCGSTNRKLNHPGPRCATCWRNERLRRKDVARDRHYRKTYGISLDDYNALKAFQGGTCPLCQRATGATKNLALDHDHATGKPRGILCGPDNQMIGQARDSIEFFQRAIDYLTNTPYDRWKDSQRGNES